MLAVGATNRQRIEPASQLSKVRIRKIEIASSAAQANRPGRCQRLQQHCARSSDDVVHRDVVSRQSHVILVQVVRSQDGQCAGCSGDRDVDRCCIQIRAVKRVNPEVFCGRDDDLTSIA